MRGFSTLEMLLAFAVLTMGLSAVVLVAFGNQSMAIDTELSNRALYVAERELEEARAGAIQTFTSLVSSVTPASGDEVFDTEIKVSDISECTKRIDSFARWETGNKLQETMLSTVLADAEISFMLGHDCATEELEDDWDNPTSFDISDPIHAGSSGTDIDVVTYEDYTYALLTSTYTNNQDTLWVLDVTDPDNADIVGGYEATDGEDFYGIDAYVDETTGIAYAFIASASTTAQLQIVEIDFSDPDNPALARVAKAQLPGVSGADPEGREVYYINDRLYIGTRRTAGHEFHVFDVSNPSAPGHIGSREINHHVNEIVVVDNWAFVASSDNSGEVIALNVTNPASIPNFDTTKFDAIGISDGKSLSVSSQYVYLGRERDKDEDDFFIVSVASIKDTTTVSDGLVGSRDLDENFCTDEQTGNTRSCLGPNTEIVGIVVRGDLAFFTTTHNTAEFQVWEVGEPENIIPHVGCNAYEFPAKPVALDFSGDYGYIAVDSNDAVRIVYDKVGACSI